MHIQNRDFSLALHCEQDAAKWDGDMALSSAGMQGRSGGGSPNAWDMLPYLSTEGT